MSDGVQKLTEYLIQTRRQAEQSIDCLTQKVIELEAVCSSYQENLTKLEEERDYFKQHVEQLKIENSKKWRLQERDDWKALVDSVQKDRDRLQDECLRLENALENANTFIEQQELLLVELQAHAEENGGQISDEEGLVATEMDKVQVSTDSGSNGNGGLHVPSDDQHDDINATPMKIRHSTASDRLSFKANGGLSIDVSLTEGHQSPMPASSHLGLTAATSPRNELKYLRAELAKCIAQREVEQRAAEAIRLSLEDEIQRLREELERYRGASSPMQANRNTAHSHRDIDNSHDNSSVILYKNGGLETRGGGGWGAFNLFGFIFYNPVTKEAKPLLRTNVTCYTFMTKHSVETIMFQHNSSLFALLASKQISELVVCQYGKVAYFYESVSMNRGFRLKPSWPALESIFGKMPRIHNTQSVFIAIEESYTYASY
eukprot:gene2586-5058_t